MIETKKILFNLNINLNHYEKERKELRKKGYTIIKNNKVLKKNLKIINNIIKQYINAKN